MKAPVFSAATRRHDAANLVLLSILGLMTVAGLLGLLDPMMVRGRGGAPGRRARGATPWHLWASASLRPCRPCRCHAPPHPLNHPPAPTQVTYAFTAYTAVDLVWVGLQPAAVPSKPSLILLHHGFTLALLAIPLKYPQLAIYTCWVRGAGAGAGVSAVQPPDLGNPAGGGWGWGVTGGLWRAPPPRPPAPGPRPTPSPARRCRTGWWR